MDIFLDLSVCSRVLCEFFPFMFILSGFCFNQRGENRRRSEVRFLVWQHNLANKVFIKILILVLVRCSLAVTMPKVMSVLVLAALLTSAAGLSSAEVFGTPSVFNHDDSTAPPNTSTTTAAANGTANTSPVKSKWKEELSDWLLSLFGRVAPPTVAFVRRSTDLYTCGFVIKSCDS